ncbi:MAG: VCBS repeat-containing protein [Pseudomonadota bacterium]
MGERLTSWACAIALGCLISAPANVVAADVIPYGEIATGTGDIAAAWLSSPTDAYPHGVLGDDLEGMQLNVKLRSGQKLAYRLEDAVFEDNTPRIADLDGDGQAEVWTIISDFFGGARLAAFAVTDGKLAPKFATDPIGRGFRWLNPLAVDDFDGDGKREAAYIETPHIGGILTIVRPRGNRLEPVATMGGYSTHIMGSPHLDLGTSVDLDGDGGAEIVLPTQSRRQLAIVAFEDGRLVERWRSGQLPTITGGLNVSVRDGAWWASYRGPDDSPQAVKLP